MNSITLTFGGETSITADEKFTQFDYGQQIIFGDLELPSPFEVHFSNMKVGKATTQIGEDNVVIVPDEYLATGLPLYGWVYLHESDSDGETEYTFKIGVTRRAIPKDAITPEQEQAITRAIALLQHPIDNIEEIVNEALAYTTVTLEELQATDAELRGDIETTGGAVSTLAGRVGTNETNITSLDARVNNLAHLTEGSTTGDAELIDGRVGADNVTYTNIGTAIRTQFSDLKSDFNDSLEVDTEIEIGINRYISNGRIIKSNSASRASTEVKIVNTKKITITPNASGLYRVALFVCKNNEWSEAQSATNSKFTYTFTDEESYAFQVLSNNVIPQDAVPFRMFVNTPSYIGEKLDARTKPSFEIEIGTDRAISNGQLDTSSDARRASTAPKKALFKSFVVIPHPPYSVSLFVRRNGIWEEAVGSAINYFAYTFTDEELYAFRVVSGSDIPQDAVPFVIDELNLAGYIEKALNSVQPKNQSEILGKDISWELGTLINGIPTTSTTRIRSDYLKVKKGEIIEAVSSNIGILNYSWFDSEYNFDETKSHGWDDGNYAVVAEDGYVRILLRKSNMNPTISESEVDELGSVVVRHDDIVGEIKVDMMITDAIQTIGLEIPSHLTKYAYKGEPISVDHKIAYEEYMTISTETSAVVQGCTAYGKYLFVAYNTLPMISIYDMEQKTHVANIQMTAVNTYHCNNINFGSEKYDSGDAFPLLYVSMENIAEHKALVFRIQESNGTYSATLVQTITYPNPAEASMYYPNCVVDAVNNRLCVMGYSTNSYIKSASNKIKVDIYDLPLLSDGNVQLNRANAKKSIEVKSLTATQGAFVNGDNIVQVYGLPQVDGDTFIGQLSLSGGAYTTLFSLTDIGLTVEPESVFVYEGNIYIFFVNRTIYKIYLA